MAWMPVAEAAARLGVSERTIWRRIKSETIQSRSEGGRTLVVFDGPSRDSDTVRQLSHVAAAQLSMRKLDADTVGEVLGQLGDCRASFEREVGRKRTALRVTALVAAALAVALGVAVSNHTDKLTRLRQDHSADLSALQSQHQEALTQQQAEIARTAGQAAAQAGEVAHLRELSTDYRAHLATLEASRDALQCTVEDRLEELTAELAMNGAAGQAGVVDRAALTKTIAELREALHRKDLVYLAAQKQSERIAAVLRAHAARHAGLAEGLRLHVALQERSLARMRSELDDLRTVLALRPNTSSPDGPGPLDDLSLRRSLRASVLSDATTPAVNRTALDLAASGRYVADVLRKWFDARLANARAESSTDEPADAFAAAE